MGNGNDDMSPSGWGLLLIIVAAVGAVLLVNAYVSGSWPF